MKENQFLIPAIIVLVIYDLSPNSKEKSYLTRAFADLYFHRPGHNLGAVDDALDTFKIGLDAVPSICSSFSDKK